MTDTAPTPSKSEKKQPATPLANDHNAYSTPLIPSRNTLNGPLFTLRQRRFYVGYWALYTIGFLLYVMPTSQTLKIVGAGLMLPGGGFLPMAFSGDMGVTIAHVALFAGTIATFIVALLLWFLTGNQLAPPIVWLAAALYASQMGHEVHSHHLSLAVPAIPVVMSLLWWIYRRRALSAALLRQKQRNKMLAMSGGGVATPLDEETGLPVVEELTEEDVAQMRFLLDRSLQPIKDFNGFDVIDQFQTAALRYQVANICYALSLANYCRMPAMRGYLAEAQRNLIEKMKEPVIWRYWRLENAWGNLQWNADPMAPDTDDNIMYSGWLAGMIGLYQSTTGDRIYNLPGALTLSDRAGKRYVYNYPEIVANACRSYERAPFSLYPCEPNWIYPTCNNYGKMAIIIEDRLNGTRQWPMLETRHNAMLNNEFTQADGRLDVARSSRIGFTPPAIGMGSEMYAALFLHASSPGIARRGWEIVKSEIGKKTKIADFLIKMDNYDFGNYRRAPTAYAPLAACAVEMGDITLASQIFAEYNEKNPPTYENGIFYRKNASVNHHAIECIARVGRANGIRDCVNVGMPTAWENGILLDKVEYPDLLVAMAVSDRERLDAVFYPGKGPGSYRIVVAQLEPFAQYRCEGASNSTVTADGDGRASIELSVRGRTPLSIYLDF